MENNGFFICPNCGNMITESNAQVCSNCTYDFGQLIKCPYKEEYGTKCLLTENSCIVKGLDFEDCSIYTNKFHENLMP